MVKLILRRSQKVGIAGISIFIFSLLYLFAIRPTFKKYNMKKNVALKSGWPMRDIWTKLPFTTEFHVYVFNITNHLEIGQGAKPIVQEIGPFVYDVHREKINQVDREDDDTVSYVPRNLFYFNKFKSNGLSDEMEVYFPHLFIMTVSNGPMKEKPQLLSWTSPGVDTILNRPQSAFYKMKVKQALFDGVEIPCEGVEEYFGKVLCNEMRERYFDFTLRKRGESFYTSMFGNLNDTYPKEKPIRIKRGIKNLKDLGKIVQWNEMDNLATWNDHQCDAFHGTDTSIFPPFLKHKQDIPIVQPLLCRKFILSYHSKVKYAGLNLHRYTTDVGSDGDHVPEDKCYCITPDTCLRKGMLELFRCINIPVIASNPHFYMADPYYLTTVDTIKPDKNKHTTYIDFDPLTGAPVRAHSKMQFNFELFPMEKFRLANNYTYAMLPLAWIDDVMVLPDFLIKDIKNAHLLITMSKVFGYFLMVTGFAVIGVGGFLEYREMTSKRTVELKPTKLKEDNSPSSSSVQVKESKLLSGLRPAKVPDNLN